MKSERRHELSTNVLADWIANMPDWWEQNGRMVTYGIVIFIAIAAVWYFAAIRTAAERAGQSVKLTELLNSIDGLKSGMARSPENRPELSSRLVLTAGQLKGLAETATNPNSAAFALIKSAEAMRASSHYSATPVEAESEVKDIRSAQESCVKAISLIKDNPSLLASAKLQLGLCQEGLGEFEAAKKTYNEIVNTPGFKGDVAVAQAGSRLAVMDDFVSPAQLAPAPAPKPASIAPAPAVQPQIPATGVVSTPTAPSTYPPVPAK
jgi:predicted negative regulator of RcsB-dependent stress response